ncbi:ephrin-A2 isoform X3 [Molossus molossus]|uniref:ephrin-A2 isoform X3 n=1 Tax=Molossus molossus TaxID=27622 RepID=UPI00174715D2|nr:ephrin-A2 isoform X3 [Molossus molossus]
MAPAQRPLLPVLLLLLLPPPPPPPPLALAEDASRANSDRYAVYWNRSNPSKCQTHEEPQTNPGEPGQKEVVGAALCPTCHRSVLLAGSWQGKETPSAGSAVARPPPVADLTALSEEPPKGMALLVWLQVPRGRGGRPRGLHCGGEHQRLLGHLLPALWGAAATGRAHGTLRAVHGQRRGPRLLRPPAARLQALGVQPAGGARGPAQVLREVPALHALLAGLRVPPGPRVLLHLCHTTQCC